MQTPANFNAELQQCSTIAACAELFRAQIRPLGFMTFACREFDSSDRSRIVFQIADWPTGWKQWYLKSGLVSSNPVLEAAAARRTSFTWSDLQAERRFARIGREALERLHDQGLRDGFVVPLPLGGSRIGVVSMAADGTAPKDAGVQSNLSLIAGCLHTRVHHLAARERFPVPPMGLTPREVECVRLVARGLSDTAIGEALGIAASTAHEFVENAKARLRVKSRPELIMVATSFGIVDL